MRGKYSTSAMLQSYCPNGKAICNVNVFRALIKDLVFLPPVPDSPDSECRLPVGDNGG